MTNEQYQRILPIRGAIMDRSASGATTQQMADFRRELQGVETNIRCGACREEMLNYLINQILEYEKTNQQHPR